MTTLDQAFVKAFTRQNTVPLAMSPRPAAPEDGRRKAEGGEGQGMADGGQGLGVSPPSEVRGAQSALGIAEGSAFSVQGLNTAESRIAQSEIRNQKSEIPNPQFLIPNPALPDSLWAALEIPPNGTERGLGGSPPSEVDHGRRTADSGQWAANQKSEIRNRKSEISHPQSLIPNPSAPPSPFLLPPSRDFKPAWQVDHFTWPRLCRRLMARAADELDRLADALLAIGRQGQKVLAVGGCCRGEGATTLLLCAARRLAERGVKPVLVDADLGRPRLAKRLGVQPQFGWDETTVAAGRSLDAAIVEATANNLALLPIREPPAECGRPAGDPARLPACLGILREHYDLVLVDLGPLENALADNSRRRTLAETIDAVILVHSPHVTSEAQRTVMEQQLAAAGIAVAGIVENFVAEE